ncbi:MAG TPA: molybdenum cofactor guanylyltransferase [Acidimicrobiales bacterium]|nr:molybdenum cofactor guanylyltransferase [Acidimicrobiales bacterium]
MPCFSGAVLTGGAGRRMGRDKALVEVGGKALAVRVAQVLRDAGADEVFAVGGALDALGDLGLPAVPDDFPGEGPLGGVLTALRHASSPLVAVLACDLLAAVPSSVRLVVATLDTVPKLACAIPMVQGRSEPLHGAWRRSSRPEIQAIFDRGERAMHRAIAGLDSAAVHGIDPAALADADTSAELAPTPPRAAF